MLHQFLAPAAAIATATFGLVALVTDFKAGGRRTVLVMVGIGLSAALSIVASALASDRAASEEDQRQRQVLRSIWVENNHIGLGAIGATVTYQYVLNNGRLSEPLFADQWNLSVLVVSDSGAPAASPDKIRWSSKPSLVHADVELTASVQTVTERGLTTVDDVQITQNSTFSGFRGDLGSYSSTARWNGAVVEAHLTSQGYRGLDEIRASVGADMYRDYAESLFDRQYAPIDPDSLVDYSIGPTPITATLSLYVRDREILRTAAVPATAWEWDEDVRALVVVDFPPVRLPDTLFPVFPVSEEPTGQSFTLVSAAWTLFGLIVIVAAALGGPLLGNVWVRASRQGG